MDNMFVVNEGLALVVLGIPTILYFLLVKWFDYQPTGQLSETIANYSLFNTLYSIFLSMALVTLLINFNGVQDDTRKEVESILSAARLMGGLSDAVELKKSLVRYAKDVVEHDLVAMRSGTLSREASAAFDRLWEQAYKTTLRTKNDETIHRLLLSELADISKSRLTRRVKAKENLHPMIFCLIVVGYYVMLIKAYLTRVNNKKTQIAYEVCTFIMIMLVITTIIDLNTPFVGIVNVDTAPFTWAYERAGHITGLTPQ
ncbi:hypothetical protein NNJEOMEG_02099 [Fundidesulfovibrio magnetotacticus]|uniref:DUF4239 domain-containing protein n=2 Tax=Fundidesulfovibrio magnetotacticus TaxID=2730080 RepID=A0A6V8LX84_9BACT|nr:hypothetical protein NNJEOMEG_02099 [Fundidesulfovibrio magnetotacticus]